MRQRTGEHIGVTFIGLLRREKIIDVCIVWIAKIVWKMAKHDTELLRCLLFIIFSINTHIAFLLLDWIRFYLPVRHVAVVISYLSLCFIIFFSFRLHIWNVYTHRITYTKRVENAWQTRFHIIRLFSCFYRFAWNAYKWSDDTRFSYEIKWKENRKEFFFIYTRKWKTEKIVNMGIISTGFCIRYGKFILNYNFIFECFICIWAIFISISVCCWTTSYVYIKFVCSWMDLVYLIKFQYVFFVVVSVCYSPSLILPNSIALISWKNQKICFVLLSLT